jgi:methylmalonyl-CoA mutase N-terminal domain/subunit
VVGVNRFVEDDDLQVPEIMRVDPAAEHEQVKRLQAFKHNRDQQLVQTRLQQVRDTAQGTDNMLPPLRQALKDHCTLGEVCKAMQDIFGRYQPAN